MKTIKFIIAGLLLAITVYSCSSDRDEESVNQSSSSKKMDLKKLKTNINHSGTAKIGDTIIPPPKSMPASTGAGEDIAPVDGGDPKDVPIPPRR